MVFLFPFGGICYPRWKLTYLWHVPWNLVVGRCWKMTFPRKRLLILSSMLVSGEGIVPWRFAHAFVTIGPPKTHDTFGRPLLLCAKPLMPFLWVAWLTTKTAKNHQSLCKVFSPWNHLLEKTTSILVGIYISSTLPRHYFFNGRLDFQGSVLGGRYYLVCLY